MSGTRRLGRGRAGPAVGSSAHLAATARAEWTKLRTMPSTPWLLLAIVATVVVVTAISTGSHDASRCASSGECPVDLTKVSLSGILFGQAVVAVLALLTITNEHGTRMIHTTLATNPRRAEVLLSKAGVVTAATLAAGLLGVAGSLLVGRIILSGNGFTSANGYPTLSLTDGATLRAAIGSVLYLGLIALLSLGIGVLVRDTAGAVTTVLTLLYVAPVTSAFLSDPQWRERLHRFGPTTAGQSIQATVGVDDLPIGPWTGLGVLAAWTAAVGLLATITFTTRDA